MGDFNVDVSNKSCPKTKLLLNLFGNYSLDLLTVTPTRITKRSATQIDLVFSNMKYVALAGSINCDISDHLPIVVVKKKACVEKSFVEVCGRSYQNFDVDSFKADVSLIDVGPILNSGDPSLIWDEFYSHLLQVANKHCPVRTFRIYTHRFSYVTPELVNRIHERNKAFKIEY